MQMNKGHEKFLFIHGWGTDNWVWEGPAKEISGGRDFFNINLPGHGGAEKWDEGTLSPGVREVKKIISEERDRTVIGAGWSLGAEVLIASSHESRKFKALVLIGATPSFIKKDGFPWGQPKALVKRMIIDMKKNPGETMNRFYRLNFTDSDSTKPVVKEFTGRYRYPGPISCDGKEAPGCFPAFKYGEITNALAALYNTDLREQTDSIDVPVLIIHGGDDNICPVGAGEYLASRIKKARLEVFENSGHAPFLTEAERFKKTVSEFMTTI